MGMRRTIIVTSLALLPCLASPAEPQKVELLRQTRQFVDSWCMTDPGLWTDGSVVQSDGSILYEPVISDHGTIYRRRFTVSKDEMRDIFVTALDKRVTLAQLSAVNAMCTDANVVLRSAMRKNRTNARLQNLARRAKQDPTLAQSPFGSMNYRLFRQQLTEEEGRAIQDARANVDAMALFNLMPEIYKEADAAVWKIGQMRGVQIPDPIVQRPASATSQAAP